MKLLAAEALIGAFILFLSVEIVVRRWVWDQIPTPIGPTATYGLLALNAVVLWFLVRRVKRAWASSRKTDRN